MPKVNKKIQKDSLVRMHKRFFKASACEHLLSRRNEEYAFGKVLEVKDSSYIIAFTDDQCASLDVKKTNISIVPVVEDDPLDNLDSVNDEQLLDGVDDDNIGVAYSDDECDNADTADVHCPSVEEEYPPADTLDTQEWDWKSGDILMDARSSIHSAHEIHHNKGRLVDPTLRMASPGKLFAAFIPTEYIMLEIIPAINQKLLVADKNNHIPLDFPEFMRWLAIWFAMCCPLRQTEMFDSKILPMPFDRLNGLDRFMSHKRFSSILLHFTFGNNEPLPDQRSTSSKYELTNPFWKAYNDNLASTVHPSHRLTIGESMNPWRGKRFGSEGMPGVRNMPPVDQEYKTLADPATNILLQLDLVQDKEAPPREFDVEFGSKSIGAMLRLVKPWTHSGRTVFANSYFGSPAAAKALLHHGFFSMMHIKKRTSFPKFIPPAILSTLPEKIGSITRLTAQIQGHHTYMHPVLLVAQRDRKPQCLIATAGTTAMGDEITRVQYKNNVRQEDTFRPASVFVEYSQCKGAVDINNTIRDNKINLHDVIKTSNGQHHVMAFAFAIAESNAYLAYRAYVMEKGPHLDHIEFRRSMVSSLLLDEYPSPSPAVKPIQQPKVTPLHELRKFKNVEGKRRIQKVCSRCQQNLGNKPRNSGKRSARYRTFCICGGLDGSGPGCCRPCFDQHAMAQM
ncbi:hypothetical protein BGZ94_009361 [Podila epigama]|nr:hypothetical protein BGZ94_009361 [Podila epigama]